MDDNTTLLIISALVVLAVIALIAGKRFKSADFNIGKLFGGTVRAHEPNQGATVSEATVAGKGHEVKAKGKGSSVHDVNVKGSNSKIIAED